MKIEKRTVIRVSLLVVIAVSAFLGTLRLQPTPIDPHRDKFYYNDNIAVSMQVYAQITSIIAGFAIAVIVLMLSQTRLQEGPNEADNRRNLLDSTVSSFIAAFLTSLLAALLYASGSGQSPPNSDRAYSVIVSPAFVLIQSLSFFSLGLIMLATNYKFKEALQATRKLYYVSLVCTLIGFSIVVYEACFRLMTIWGMFLFMILALSVGALCFIIWQTYNDRKSRKFYERKFNQYLVTCIICCLGSYLVMTLYIEDQYDDSWLMPQLLGESFLLVFSLLMGWSLTYVPTRKESLEYWSGKARSNKNANQ
jgi:heme/copper-type cytochrome/quinol oxidase subunit 4